MATTSTTAASKWESAKPKLTYFVIGLIAGQILQPSFAVSRANFTPNPFVVGIIGVITALAAVPLIVLYWVVSQIGR